MTGERRVTNLLSDRAASGTVIYWTHAAAHYEMRSDKGYLRLSKAFKK